MVTRTELLAAEITRHQIDERLRAGSLIRQHRGVYCVAHKALSVESRYMAAVRACGNGALLSGAAGGYLLSLLKGRAPPPEVIAPTERRVQGVVIHRCRQMVRRDATTCRGIPVTTVPRTLVDLAAVLDFDALARACHEAGVRYGTTPRHVDEVLDRRPSSPGGSKLRAILRGDAHVILSALERRFLRLLKEAGLPLPQTNRAAGGRRVDCRWTDPPLTVELDSYRYHSSRHAWEQDRRREREAYARGDEFRRYTHGEVFEDAASAAMLSELRRAAPRAKSGDARRYRPSRPER